MILCPDGRPVSQYPDGAVLLLGTLFALTKDRDGSGQGFTHKVGDIVTVAAADWAARQPHAILQCAPWRLKRAILHAILRAGACSPERCRRRLRRPPGTEARPRPGPPDCWEGRAFDASARELSILVIYPMG